MKDQLEFFSICSFSFNSSSRVSGIVFETMKQQALLVALNFSRAFNSDIYFFLLSIESYILAEVMNKLAFATSLIENASDMTVGMWVKNGA